MQIIISPAKKMTEWIENEFVCTLPLFPEKSRELLAQLQQFSTEELKQLWRCSDKLVQTNQERLDKINLMIPAQTPALFAYQGAQYQSLQATSLTEAKLSYLNKNLWILSGFYGALRPLTGIQPYRLEMKSKLPNYNLYQFWGQALAEVVFQNDQLVLNLASKEYAKVLEPHLKAGQKMVTCMFAQLKEGKLKQQSMPAKKARGAMGRYLASCQATTIDQVKDFAELDYVFVPEYSNNELLVFIQKN